MQLFAVVMGAAVSGLSPRRRRAQPDGVADGKLQQVPSKPRSAEFPCLRMGSGIRAYHMGGSGLVHGASLGEVGSG